MNENKKQYDKIEEKVRLHKKKMIIVAAILLVGFTSSIIATSDTEANLLSLMKDDSITSILGFYILFVFCLPGTYSAYIGGMILSLPPETCFWFGQGLFYIVLSIYVIIKKKHKPMCDNQEEI